MQPATEQILALSYQQEPQRAEGEVERMLRAEESGSGSYCVIPVLTGESPTSISLYRGHTPRSRPSVVLGQNPSSRSQLIFT